jgi:CheY-like chemotaxis protein
LRFGSTGLKGSKLAHLQAAATRHRVLVADDDTPFARRLCDYLVGFGFECRITPTISEAKHLVEFWKPDSVFIDLMLPESNALALCRFIQTKSLIKIPKIIVMSKQTLPQGIETMRRAGAAHYLVKPFEFEEAFRAVESRPPEPREGPKDHATKELHLLNLFLKQALVDGTDRMGLFNLMRMISLKVRALRCSMIQCLNDDTGLVVASNDDENIRGLPLQLLSYPEVREVRRTQRPLIISNVRTSDLMSPAQGRLAATGFASIAVFPLFHRGRFYGVLSLRLEQQTKVEMHYIEKFGQVCSQIISLAIASKAP